MACKIFYIDTRHLWRMRRGFSGPVWQHSLVRNVQYSRNVITHKDAIKLAFSGPGMHLPLTATLTTWNYLLGNEKVDLMTEMLRLFLRHSLHTCVCILSFMVLSSVKPEKNISYAKLQSWFSIIQMSICLSVHEGRKTRGLNFSLLAFNLPAGLSVI